MLQHFPLSADIHIVEPVLRQTKHIQQQKILALYGYRACNAAQRVYLMEKARHVVKISAKAIYKFQTLIYYLETQRIVRPGYSYLQDVVSQTLGDKRERIAEIIKRSLDTELGQQIWADCSGLLANCVIYYNACILSELLERRGS